LAAVYPQLVRAMASEDSLVNVAINEQMFLAGIQDLRSGVRTAWS